MFLLQMITGQRIILLVIIGLGLSSLLLSWVKRNVCRKHWTMKTLKPYNIESNERYCEQCMHESTNPAMKCPCGWKGRLSDCGSRNVTTDVPGCFNEYVSYTCPTCEKEIIQYDN